MPVVVPTLLGSPSEDIKCQVWIGLRTKGVDDIFGCETWSKTIGPVFKLFLERSLGSRLGVIDRESTTVVDKEEKIKARVSVVEGVRCSSNREDEACGSANHLPV